MNTSIASTPPVTRRVRAYFAPVNRTLNLPSTFDPSQSGSFPLDTPPAPWIDLGWCSHFVRACGTKYATVAVGSPAMPQSQLRTEVDASISLQFEQWGKLQLALAAGSQQMNLLTPAANTGLNGSGGMAAAALPLTTENASTATQLSVGMLAAATFTVGSLVAVDVDYTGQTGFIGSGISAAYIKPGSAVKYDTHTVRRFTLNVGRVVSIANGVLQLATPLPAGAPTASMKVSTLVGFVDREGGSFFQEWSGLFVYEGEQGDRVLFHYPRLQAMQGSAEILETLTAPLEQVRLAGAFCALPVADANDGELILCFRSYLPAPLRTV